MSKKEDPVIDDAVVTHYLNVVNTAVRNAIKSRIAGDLDSNMALEVTQACAGMFAATAALCINVGMPIETAVEGFRIMFEGLEPQLQESEDD